MLLVSLTLKKVKIKVYNIKNEKSNIVTKIRILGESYMKF